MLKKLLLSAALTLAIAAPAMADTPMGPGVTGMGGTGPNKSDPPTGAKPDREVGVQRPEGSEPISGNAKAEAAMTKEDAPRALTHPSAPDATGATRGSGAGGRATPESNKR
jgi:hypothetical protein